jgi:hypothetical protein
LLILAENVSNRLRAFIYMHKKSRLLGFISKMEQATGIGPASAAWEAAVLPLNYACTDAFFGFLIIQ